MHSTHLLMHARFKRLWSQQTYKEAEKKKKLPDDVCLLTISLPRTTL